MGLLVAVQVVLDVSQFIQVVSVAVMLVVTTFWQGYLLLSRFNSLMKGVDVIEFLLLIFVTMIPFLSVTVALLLAVPWETIMKKKKGPMLD